jgi:uncharacterized coiled-coil protein SlyX
MGTVEEPQTDVERLAELERKQAEQDRKQAEQAAELARLKGAETPLEAAMRVAMRSPEPSSAWVREGLARQEAARLARVRAVEAAAEQLELERRVRAPEIAKHQRKLAAISARVAEEREAFEKHADKLAELEGERAGVMREAPVFAPPSMGRPIKVGDDPSDRRRWRLGGTR